jgi:hypothetical protein
MGCPALHFQIGRSDVGDQGQEELEPGSVGGSGVKLDSSGKQCCLIKALKALCLAFSRRSSSVSFSICLVSLAIRSLSLLTRKISLSSCYGFAGLLLHPQLVLNLALLVLHHAQLVAGIPSPIQHR